eukprot:scaffold6456_cov147-Amphora_coffeaeformis.AAC.3
MSEYDHEVGKKAKQAFESPTNLAAQKIGFRVSANMSPTGGASVASARSRRSASVIKTPDEADLFDQMTKANSVKLRIKKNKVSNNLFSGATSAVLQTFSYQDAASEVRASPASPHGSSFSAGYEGENYFSPGGSLAISSPGRPTHEKDFDWNKQHEEHRKRNASSPMDEKKTADDSDHVVAKASTQNVPPTGLVDTEENTKILSPIFNESKEAVLAAVNHQQNAPTPTFESDWTTAASEAVSQEGSIGQAGSNESRTNSLQKVSSARQQEEESPHHSVVRVETVNESRKLDESSRFHSFVSVFKQSHLLCALMLFFLDTEDSDDGLSEAEVTSMEQANVAPTETKSTENQSEVAETNDVLHWVNSTSTTVQQDRPEVFSGDKQYQDATKNIDPLQSPVIDSLSAVESEVQLQQAMDKDPNVDEQEKEEEDAAKNLTDSQLETQIELPAAPRSENEEAKNDLVDFSDMQGELEIEHNCGLSQNNPEKDVSAKTEPQGTTNVVDLLGWTEAEVGTAVNEQTAIAAVQKDADTGGLREAQSHHEKATHVPDLLDFTDWQAEANAYENSADPKQEADIADARMEPATNNRKSRTDFNPNMDTMSQDEATKSSELAARPVGTTPRDSDAAEQNTKPEYEVFVGSESHQEQAKDMVDWGFSTVATPDSKHLPVEMEKESEHAPEIQQDPATDLLDLASPPTESTAECELNANSANARMERTENPVTELPIYATKPEVVIRNNSLLETFPQPPKTFIDSSEGSPRQSMGNLAANMGDGVVVPTNPMVSDPCGMASETFENIGCFMGQGSCTDKNVEDVERDAMCSVVSDPEHQKRISEVVASLSNSMSAVGLANDHDATCSSPCHEDCVVDLRGDDAEFRLVAQNAVAFLQSRLEEEKFTITIEPSDRQLAADILPTGIRYQFFDALRYRLSVAPKEPISDLDFLVLKCQELGLDVEAEKNPMLAAVSIVDHSLSFDVLHILENKQPLSFVNEPKPDTSSEMCQNIRKINNETEKVSTGVFNELAASKSSPESDAQKIGENQPAGQVPFASPVSNSTTTSGNQEKPLTALVPPSRFTVESATLRSLGVDGSAAPFTLTTDQSAEGSGISQGGSVPEGEPPNTILPDPSESYTPIVSLSQEPLVPSGDRSVSSAKGDSLQPENQNGPASHGASAFVPPPNAFQTGTDNDPNTGSLNPFLPRRLPQSQDVMPPSYFAMSGPPSETSHQIRPTSAMSGLESTMLSADPKRENVSLQRLQAEILEATRYAEAAEKPDTKAFWRSHVQDLQTKLNSLQRSGSSGMVNQQTTAEDPVEQPKISPGPSSTPNVGDYYAMEDENAHQRYNSDNKQSRQMQALEYESRMVDVIAPADLPGGYHFEAEIEGQRFLATVPAGGVQQGETFTCYMRELNSVAIDIPVGYWKDNMCQMCKHGLCHPTLWHALFCPLGKSFTPDLIFTSTIRATNPSFFVLLHLDSCPGPNHT